MAEVQDAGIFIGPFLSKALQLSGYHGCGAQSVLNHTGDARFDFTSETAFKKYKAMGSAWVPELPNELKNKVVPGTDAFSVLYLDPDHFTSLTVSMMDHQHLKVLRPVNFKVDDVVMIADCEHAEIVRVAQIKNLNDRESEVTVSPSLEYQYARYSLLGAVVKNTFFIGESKMIDENGEFLPAFYMEDTQGKDHEVIQNVVDLQFDDDSEPDGIISMHVLLKSHAVIQAMPGIYRYMGEEQTAPDGALYKEWMVNAWRRNG